MLLQKHNIYIYIFNVETFLVKSRKCHWNTELVIERFGIQQLSSIADF